MRSKGSCEPVRTGWREILGEHNHVENAGGFSMICSG